MKTAIIGSRGFTDYEKFMECLYRISNFVKITEVISGGAKGADTLAERFASQYHVDLTRIVPDWQRFGRKAGILRNREIVRMADCVIAFWDGSSRGTAFTIAEAQRAHKLLIIFPVPPS